MPGIVGIVDLQQPDSIPRIFTTMKEALEYDQPHRECSCSDKNAAFAVLQRENDKLLEPTCEDADTILAFWGTIWDKDDLMIRAGRQADTEEAIDIGPILHELYRKKGIEGFYSLNGRFTIALWNKKQKTLQLIPDRYGFCKLYYWTTPGRILFASQYKAFIQHKDFRKDVDEQGIASFVSLGYPLGCRTFFKDVKVMPHGSTLIFRNGNMETSRYWDYSFRDGNEPLYEIDEYVDAYYEILKRVMLRQLRGRNRLVVPLSGGLDSRTLAGMLDKVHFQGEVEAFSYGNEDCFDVIYGRKIAQKLHIKHSYLSIDSTYLSGNSEQFVWLTEGMVNSINSHMLISHDVIKNTHSSSVMTGFLGDTITDMPIFGLELFKKKLAETEFILRAFDKQTEIIKRNEMGHFLKQHVYAMIKDGPLNAYRADFNSSTSDRRFHRSVYAELVGRQKYYTSFNIHAFESIAEVLAPYTDNEFVDFALSLPDVLRQKRYLQREVIRKHLSKVGSVPWNKTRLPLNVSRIRQGLHWRWEKLLNNHILKATIGRKYTKMNDNYMNSGEAIRTGSRDFVVSHIKNNPFLAEYFQMDRVHRMIDEHMEGRVHESGKITALLTLSLWYKLFIEGHGYKGGID